MSTIEQRPASQQLLEQQNPHYQQQQQNHHPHQQLQQNQQQQQQQEMQDHHQQQLQHQQPQQRRRQRNGRAPKYPLTQTLGPSNRRIYDLRRWHRRKSSDRMSSSDGGQPPAGWVLVWAGRFKRWRRRWFVAHPPGLLLYYKNSDQLGRPGCINLQGAEVAPTTGKERQLKIRRGSRIYYLRTLNRENRQAWLETINKSICIYEKMWQKVGVGVKPGASLSLQQSVPLHLAEEWREQERELSRRLADRMHQLEPMRQAFLQQLHALQQSLSVISGALGFTNGVDPGNSVPTSLRASFAENSVVMHHREIISIPGHVEPSSYLERKSVPIAGLQGSFVSPDKPAITSKGKTSRSNTQLSLVSSLSEPIPGALTDTKENVVDGQKSKGQHYDNGDTSSIPEYDLLRERARCIGREFFRRRRRERTGPTSSEKEHSSDTEIWSSINSTRPSFSGKGNGSAKVHQANLSASQSADRFPLKYAEDPSDKVTVPKNLNDFHQTDARQSIKTGEQDSDIWNEGSQFDLPSNATHTNILSHPVQGQLHAAWKTMQDAFAEILKEEIQRGIELEAENAVLQQSLAKLPHLQQDHRDPVDLKERIQRGKLSSGNAREVDRYNDGEFSDDEDTDDDVSIVHSDVTNEDYYEALEVLNQHEYIAKATSPEELEVLAERAENTQDPPEEGESSVDAENLSEVEGEEYEHPRTRLPAPRPLSRGFSLWSVLKNAIGKDLNHITMPATINEPLSVLQRCAEELQYGPLLEKASHLDDSIERLVWVSVFACATYHGSPHRDAKPFNPLLGETYEWQSPDARCRFIAEQVSHHPPVLAFHCENMLGDYTIYGEVEIKNKFWGKSVEVLPAGVVHLCIPRFGDHFTWSKITTCIHNVVVGKLWIDNYGELTIKNHSTGEFSRIRFQKASSREQGCLTGKVFDKQGIPQCSIYGNYMKEISIIPEPSWSRKEVYGNAKCLWNCPELPEDYEQQYCFSRFTIGLNELTPKLREVLPPTDSRLRPDLRALEDGDLDKATPEKLRLEEKQREARKKRKELGQEWTCMWFQQRVPGVSQVKTPSFGDEEPTWIYTGKYWDARERQDWRNCPDIM